MTKKYLLKLNFSIPITSYVELPLCFLPGWFLRSQLLEPMCLATVGSVESAYLAMNKGWAINLSGGYHHATREFGGGFCVYPDITFITHYIRKNYAINKILIIDLDAHQGNGHERDHLGVMNIRIFDAYNYGIYPNDTYAKGGITSSMNVNHNTSDKMYLTNLDKNLDKIINDFQPEFIVYNAGTDCLEGDPLGACNMTP